MSKQNKGPRKCLDCGSSRVTTKVGAYRMKLADSWAVTVQDAIITTCEGCAGVGVGFQNLDGLMRAIAAAVVAKPTRLAAEEIKFLRTHLGYSGVQLAKLLGVGPPTVSRWENGHEPIGAVPDRLLRALDVIRDGAENFDVEALAAIGDKPGTPLRLRVRIKDGVWQAAA